MRLDHRLLSEIKGTIESGYYERNGPTRREKRSLCEAIDCAHAAAQLPLLLEVATALPESGLLRPSRQETGRLIDELAKTSPVAMSLWVEPKCHAGDLRWLGKELGAPILCKDWIIDPRQIVGGDAVLLCMPLIKFAGADIHALIEAAHEQDMEAVLEAFSPEQLALAKETEADIIAINNHGSNGSAPGAGHSGSPSPNGSWRGADVNTTVQMLSACKTGRPVISTQGITDPAQVRALISAGATALELAAAQACGPLAADHITTLRRAVLGKDPVLASVPEMTKGG